MLIAPSVTVMTTTDVTRHCQVFPRGDGNEGFGGKDKSPRSWLKITVLWGGGRVSWDEVREWHGHIYTTKCKIDSQWEAAA